MENLKNRRSSILKKTPRTSSSGHPEIPNNRLKRRISFSGIKSVKEFCAGEEEATIWGTSYEEADANPLTNGIKSGKLKLKSGQVAQDTCALLKSNHQICKDVERKSEIVYIQDKLNSFHQNETSLNISNMTSDGMRSKVFTEEALTTDNSQQFDLAITKYSKDQNNPYRHILQDNFPLSETLDSTYPKSNKTITIENTVDVTFEPHELGMFKFSKGEPKTELILYSKSPTIPSTNPDITLAITQKELAQVDCYRSKTKTISRSEENLSIIHKISAEELMDISIQKPIDCVPELKCGILQSHNQNQLTKASPQANIFTEFMKVSENVNKVNNYIFNPVSNSTHLQTPLANIERQASKTAHIFSISRADKENVYPTVTDSSPFLKKRAFLNNYSPVRLSQSINKIKDSQCLGVFNANNANDSVSMDCEFSWTLPCNTSMDILSSYKKNSLDITLNSTNEKTTATLSPKAKELNIAQNDEIALLWIAESRLQHNKGELEPRTPTKKFSWFVEDTPHREFLREEAAVRKSIVETSEVNSIPSKPCELSRKLRPTLCFNKMSAIDISVIEENASISKYQKQNSAKLCIDKHGKSMFEESGLILLDECANKRCQQDFENSICMNIENCEDILPDMSLQEETEIKRIKQEDQVKLQKLRPGEITLRTYVENETNPFTVENLPTFNNSPSVLAEKDLMCVSKNSTVYTSKKRRNTVNELENIEVEKSNEGNIDISLFGSLRTIRKDVQIASCIFNKTQGVDHFDKSLETSIEKGKTRCAKRSSICEETLVSAEFVQMCLNEKETNEIAQPRNSGKNSIHEQENIDVEYSYCFPVKEIQAGCEENVSTSYKPRKTNNVLEHVECDNFDKISVSDRVKYDFKKNSTFMLNKMRQTTYEIKDIEVEEENSLNQSGKNLSLQEYPEKQSATFGENIIFERNQFHEDVNDSVKVRSFDTIDIARRATNLRKESILEFDPVSTVFNKSEIIGDQKNEIRFEIEDKPVAISDDSVIFSETHPTEYGPIFRNFEVDGGGGPKISDSDETISLKIARYKKSFLELTCNSVEDEIDKTCISLVDTLEDESANNNILKEKIFPLETSQSDNKQCLSSNILNGPDGEISNSSFQHSICGKCKRHQRAGNLIKNHRVNCLLLDVVPAPISNTSTLKNANFKSHIINLSNYWQKRWRQSESFFVSNTTGILSSCSDNSSSTLKFQTENDIVSKLKCAQNDWKTKVQMANNLRCINKQEGLQYNSHLMQLKREKWSWIITEVFSIVNVLKCNHKHFRTFAIVVTYSCVDSGSNFTEIDDIKLTVLKRNLEPIEYALHFQLLIELPYSLKSIYPSMSNLMDMLVHVDRVAMEVVKLGLDLWRVVLDSNSMLIRDPSGITYIKKIVRKKICLKEAIANNDCNIVKKCEFLIVVGNMNKISYKDIEFPPLYKFDEKIELLPIGLEFLRVFLRNPLYYLK